MIVAENNLKTMSIREFAIGKAITQVSPVVRENVNGYPYITFINKDNVAENIYFSKAGAKAVSSGSVVDKALLQGFQIGLVKNEAGEDRVKLISNSDRIELMDLLD